MKIKTEEKINIRITITPHLLTFAFSFMFLIQSMLKINSEKEKH